MTKPETMTGPIRAQQEAARALEPDATQRAEWLRQMIDYTERYLESVATAPANSARADKGKALLGSPFSEAGSSLSQLLALFSENVDSTGLNPTSGRFLGYIPGGGVFPSALGDFLAAVTNRYAGHFFASPGAVRLENTLLKWMAELVGYPAESAGNLTSGGSLAMLSAIVTARDSHGIEGSRIRQSVVYTTEHVHHCLDKALHVAGLEGCVRRSVDMDARHRMKPADLADKIVADQRAGLNPWLIVATAGTTNTGAVDPLLEINPIARQYGLWLHVDGAYGAFFVLCPEGRQVLQGLDGSDSMVMDPHKTLFLPYGTGAVLVKERQKLYASNTWKASYTQDFPEKIEELSPAELSAEMTKHFRGLRLWLPLKLLGIAPFRAALSEKIWLARYFHERMKSLDGFEVGPPPELSIVTYRYRPQRGEADEFNRLLTQTVQEDGRVFVSSTRIEGKYMLRAAISCFRTHLEDIDETIEVLRRTAARISGNLV